MGMLCAVAIASLGAAVAAADDGEIRLMSYNILHGKGADRKVDIRRTAEAIVRERPDFVGLQEVDCHVSRSGRIDEPAELARLTGLHPTFASAFPYKGGEYGRAILSREKPLAVERVRLDGKHPGVLLLCEFPDFWFGTMHLDLAETNRLRQVGIVRNAVAAKSRDKPVFLTGDWNATPKSRTLAAMREFMTVLSTEKHRTFHGFKGGKIAKDYCIDYIAIDNAHAEKVAVWETHVTEEPVASDHNPVVAVVALGAAVKPVEERVRQTPGGPRIFVDGKAVRPRDGLSLKKGLPIILCMHCPIDTPRIRRAANKYWKRDNLKAVVGSYGEVEKEIFNTEKDK